MIMKRLLFLIPVLVLSLVACAVDDPSPTNDGQTDIDDNTDSYRFLSVNIISNSTGSRAGEDTKYEDGNAPEYEDGTGAENYIYKVRFYFFTESGDAAAIKYTPASDGTGRYLSYYDWYPTTADSEDSTDNNIEKILSVQIVIDSRQNDYVPYSIAAVLNPSEEYKNSTGDQNLSLNELRAVLCSRDVKDLSQEADSNGKFEMSNSVYVDNAGRLTDALPVADYLRASVDEASANPVKIYMERVAARLDLSVAMQSLDGHPGVYDTGVPYDKIRDYAGDKPENRSANENIHVKFIGWNVTAAADKSRLIKNIDKEWSETLFGWLDEPWNNHLRFRSYWAINPDDVNYTYGNFGQALDGSKYEPADKSAANANSYFGTAAKKAVVYMQENAAKDNEGMQEPFDHTKVIIAAQLVMGDGVTPVTIAEWGLNYYTLDGVKTLLADNLDLYRRTGTENDGYRYVKITPQDIEFVTAGSQDPRIKSPASNGGAPENSSEKNKGRYYVYPRLVEDGSTWTQGEGDDALLLNSYGEADEIVKRLGKVKIWNNGYTYYYFSINHLGNSGCPGEYGVVRNHIYNASINALKGLGTPVYDPNETIYPEKPENDDTMIAARINVINWRLVKKRIQVSW